MSDIKLIEHCGDIRPEEEELAEKKDLQRLQNVCNSNSHKINNNNNNNNSNISNMRAATPYLCALYVATAGHQGNLLGSDEQEIVLLIYVVIDMTTNTVSPNNVVYVIIIILQSKALAVAKFADLTKKAR